MSGSVTRRSLLRQAAALAAISFSAPFVARPALGQTRFLNDPFALGVASGAPVADGFVLWTRLAPLPLDGGGMLPDVAVPVKWQVATERTFKKPVRQGIALARPERAHAVHVDVQGLEPDRWYFYRFMAGDATSPVGRARTFPVIGAPAARLRFAVASCQHFQVGHFTAYKAMLADDLDCVVHVGDYVYEYPRDGARFHVPEPFDLDGYRTLHALYKTDVHLRAAHAAYPFLVTWDDHEVENDYAGADAASGLTTEAFLKRRAAAYQAYWEHMPLRLSALPKGPDAMIYGAHQFGDLARLILPDGRQYRSNQACESPGKLGGQVIENCAERDDPARSMYGAQQERWLNRALVSPGARWRVLAQQMMMAQLDQKPGPGQAWWSEGWDGYPAARKRLLGLIAERKIPNVVVLSGDIHTFWANDLKADFDDPAAPVLATEFVATSVTSPGESFFRQFLPDNPHVKYFEDRHRGYLRCEVTPEAWRTDLMAVNSIADPLSGSFVLKRFVVENGKAGVVEG